ncbi:hypothetical protein GJAV_G00080860 [Gymnothorax javanicus]|nr:hypothetical protein GJAV_G00080860 [Gymnothorax javanicus]
MGEVRNGMEELKFRVHWNNRMELQRNSTIYFQCSGPYVVYVSACSLDMESQNNNGTLVLHQRGIDRMTILLRSQDECHGEHLQRSQKHQRILTFTKNDTVSLKFTSESLKLRYLHLGFHYLLGGQCFKYV